MNESRFIAGVRFVVDATCAHIEKLPKIDISPEMSVSPEMKSFVFSGTKTPRQKWYNQVLQREDVFSRYSQQGVKRSCGQSQKNVREECAKISS